MFPHFKKIVSESVKKNNEKSVYQEEERAYVKRHRKAIYGIERKSGQTQASG